MTARMLRLAGGGLLTLTGALFGIGKRRELLRQKETLCSVSNALGRLAGELTALQSPLPEAFSHLTDCGLFLLLSVGFGTEPLEVLWRRATELQPIPAEAKNALSGLGAVLGRFDVRRQAGEIDLVRRRLEAEVSALDGALSGRARRYGGLGAALGAMLAVLLF